MLKLNTKKLTLLEQAIVAEVARLELLDMFMNKPVAITPTALAVLMRRLRGFDTPPLTLLSARQ